MTPAIQLFTAETLTFLRALKRNNRREWFEENRPRYERAVLTPLRALAEELDVRFATLAPEFVGDRKRSLFRIHRDVRFSKDKSPYKTHAALWVFHRSPGRGVGKEIDGGAGFYFHIEPGASMVAAGLWMPPRHLLTKVREHFDADLKGWERAVLAPAFRKRVGRLTDDEPGVLLKRLPRGYEEGHAAERWLRFNSFTVGRSYADKDVLSPRVVDTAMTDYAAMLPMVRWLNRALGFLPASSR